MSNNNLLKRLCPLASQQEENFFTESLAHFLCYLIDHEPAMASELLFELTGVKFSSDEIRTNRPRVRTQVLSEKGRPDIEIETDASLILIEVKIGAKLGKKQLERYQEALAQRAKGKLSILATLSLDPLEVSETIREKVIERSWYEIASWVNLRIEAGLSSQLTKYLSDQFCGLLRERGMLVQKVDDSLKSGMNAYKNLSKMIRQVAKERWKTTKLRYGLSWLCYECVEDGIVYSLVVEHETPSIILLDGKATGNHSLVRDSSELKKVRLAKEKWHAESVNEKKKRMENKVDEPVVIFRAEFSLNVGGFFEKGCAEQIRELSRFVEKSRCAIREAVAQSLS